jgi:hypothetical protein
MMERARELVPDLIRRQGRDGQCKYDPSAIAELVRRSLLPGVSANLVPRWVMLALRDRTSARASRAALLQVVTTAEAAAAPAPIDPTPKGESVLEVVLPGDTIRIRRAVESSPLTTLIDCLQRPERPSVFLVQHVGRVVLIERADAIGVECNDQIDTPSPPGILTHKCCDCHEADGWHEAARHA